MNNPRTLLDMSSRIVNQTIKNDKELKPLPKIIQSQVKDHETAIYCDETFDIDGKKINYYFSTK